MKNKTIILLLSLMTAILVGCTETPTQTEEQDEKFTIYTTVYPIQYITERLGGNFVQTETIYPPGTDAHSYEPTAKEMTKIATGDAFFYLGGNLEPFAENIATALSQEPVTFIELGLNEELFESVHVEDKDEVEHEHVHKDEKEPKATSHDGHNHKGHSHADHDPHIWLDPIRMMELASTIQDEMVQLFPEHRDTIMNNLESLSKDLKQLDEEFQEVLSTKKQKKILVSHAAYGYWEERFGIEQIAVNGIAANSEPSQKDLIHIIDQAKAHDLQYMIFEQNVSEKVSEQIKDEIGASTATLHNLAVLTESDLSQNEDYISIMKQNLNVLDRVTN